MAIDYRRLPIEIESPEQLGYDRIRNNLAESSVADLRLSDVGLALGDLVLQYGDHRGQPELRARVAADEGRSSPGRALTAEDVLTVPGAAAALFIVASSLVDRGDHVVVARPNYATNLETPRALGAEVSVLDLRHEDGWRVDVDRLEALVRPETRLISLTSPHNPTGQRIDEATMRAIVELVEAHPRAHLLLDETYRELAYDGPAPMVAGLTDRAIGVSSLSKAYGLPGIRLGWISTRHAGLMDRFLAAKEHILITGSVIDEAVGNEALRRRIELLPPILAEVRTALDLVRGWLAEDERFEWVEPTGGVVGFPRIRPDVTIDPDVFYRVLFERHGTVVGPGHWFDQPRRHFRLGFGWPARDRLLEGLAALSAAATEASA
jgi:aspartate/methionine/tyrosine aminotransferase